MIKHITVIILIFFCAVWFPACASNPDVDNGNHVPFKLNSNAFTRWDEIFADDVLINFTFIDPDLEIYKIGGMLISPSGDYFILDPKMRKVIQFDESGKFVRYIGRYGEGPGEYSLAACPYMDKHNNFYIYDPYTFRINKYSYPDYKFEVQIKLALGIQDFILDQDGNFITYTISDHYVLHKIDSSGDLIRKALAPKQINFRLFSARFQLGRLSEIPGEGFLSSYPEEYKIYFFDDQLNIKKVLYTEKKSRFFPAKAQFPGTLSPYDFTPKHSKWWSQSLRPAVVYYLGNKIFITVLLKYTNLSIKCYLNLHTVDGSTYAYGVEVPFDGIIRYVGNSYIYVVEESKFDGNGNVIPLKLHRFKLNEKIKESTSGTE